LIPSAQQFSQNLPEDAGFLSDKSAVIGVTIKETLCFMHLKKPYLLSNTKENNK
jgi:hypothetical protein